MFSTTNLENYLQQSNPYPCLSLLESGTVCYNLRENKTIPSPLLGDLYSIFGQHIAETALEDLIVIHVLVRTEQGIMLNPEALSSISAILCDLSSNLLLQLDGREETAANFLRKFVSYLKKNESDLIITESNGSEYIISWQGRVYQLQLAFSPVWLPAAAEQAAQRETFVALFGPFVAQGWYKIIKYYNYPEFRNYTSYFDPWHCQKMSISKGRLLTYYDWFLRDVYGRKCFIPETFSLALKNMGLLRYNDEL